MKTKKDMDGLEIVCASCKKWKRLIAKGYDGEETLLCKKCFEEGEE